ncbi:MAG: cupin domain-containing protein [Actinomycetota bacterium]
MYVPDIHSLVLVDITDVRAAEDAPRFGDHVLSDDGQVQIGIWSASPGVLCDPTGDYVETMFMVAGRATVAASEGSPYDLVPGALWATPRHWVGPWEIHQTVRKLYVIDNRPAMSCDAGASTYLANAYASELDAPVRRPVVIAGDPHEASRMLWAHDQLEAGVWECTPGEFPFRRDGYDEVFCVLSGRATLYTDAGQAFELTPGTVMLTPAGLCGRWVVHDTIRKAYTIVLGRG